MRYSIEKKSGKFRELGSSKLLQTSENSKYD